MENQKNQVVLVQPKRKLTLRQKVGTAVATGTALVLTAPAHAEGTLVDGIMETAKAEFASLRNGQTVLFGLALTVLIGFAVWRYTKRSANTL